MKFILAYKANLKEVSRVVKEKLIARGTYDGNELVLPAKTTEEEYEAVKQKFEKIHLYGRPSIKLFSRGEVE